MSFVKQAAFILLIYFGLGVIFSFFEWRRPAARIRYREVILGDLWAFAAFAVLTQVVAFGKKAANGVIYSWGSETQILIALRSCPLWLKIILFTFLVDFGRYWMHRVMHTKLLWRTHKWHHYPTYMYWLAGLRTSFFQQIIYYFPDFIFLWVFDLPSWMLIPLLIQGIFLNHWMHANIRFRIPVLEKILVTPRFHHIHHSDIEEHYVSNLGSTFSFWDKMFGTFYDPERIQKPIRYGIGEKVNTIRLIIGL